MDMVKAVGYLEAKAAHKALVAAYHSDERNYRSSRGRKALAEATEAYKRTEELKAALTPDEMKEAIRLSRL